MYLLNARNALVTVTFSMLMPFRVSKMESQFTNPKTVCFGLVGLQHFLTQSVLKMVTRKQTLIIVRQDARSSARGEDVRRVEESFTGVWQ